MDLENIRVRPVWPKSKDEAWYETFAWLDEHEEKKGYLRHIPVWSYAASLLIPILLFCHFYAVTENAARGEQTEVQLPDRSMVTLNAESKISYKPIEWWILRKVTLEGEACFEVKSGSRFSVLSGLNRVSVLGTTFNVYARPEAYRVTCLTGKIEVNIDRETVVLQPNMQATCRERKIILTSNVVPAAATGWMQGKFVFDGTPLREVIAEVERQYNINVASDYDSNHLYSGVFTKTEKPEEVLEIIGKSFGITFSIK